MANSVNLDKNASLEAFLSRLTLFAQAYLSECLYIKLVGVGLGVPLFVICIHHILLMQIFVAIKEAFSN